MILLASVLKPSEDDSGPRYLIDWEWPMGGHHQALHLADWPRELLPDEALWDWFHRDPVSRLTAFKRRYFRQLERCERSWLPLAFASFRGNVTLLYNLKHEGLTPARFLKEFLEERRADVRRRRPFHPKCAGLGSRGVAPPAGKSFNRAGHRPLKPKLTRSPRLF